MDGLLQYIVIDYNGCTGLMSVLVCFETLL